MPGRRGRASAPTECFADWVINTFVASVDGYAKADGDLRNQLGRALIDLEEVNWELRRYVWGTRRLPFYRYFFHSVNPQTTIPWRFCDGTFGVTLLSGSHGTGIPVTAAFSSWNVAKIHEDRFKTALKLTGEDLLEKKHAVKAASLYVPEDLPSGVGLRVSAFVGRMRFLCQNTAAWKRELCAHCDRAGCSAPCLVANFVSNNQAQIPGIDQLPTDYSSDSGSECDPSDAGEFWKLILPKTRAVAPHRTFCSLACERAYTKELNLAVTFDINNLDPLSHRKVGQSGLSRVAHEARSCWIRNGAQARALRAAKLTWTRMRFKTLGPEFFEQLQADVRDLLNIDLALVAAAATVAESQEVAKNRTLPATCANWRSDAHTYKRAIAAVRIIYKARFRDNDGIAADERNPPRWLKKVLESAQQIFPVSST